RRDGRPRAGAQHDWRHLRRALHPFRLPGRRVRPRRPHHAQGGRTGRPRRPRRADRYLYEGPRALFRRVTRMTSLRDDASALYGAWRLACFDRGGIAWFDRSVSGFWRSFRAGVFSYPAFLILLGLGFVDGGPSSGDDPFRVWMVATIGYVISWTALPLVMLPVSRFLGREPRWLDFIIAYNWSQLLQYALLLATAGIAGSGLLPEALAISIVQAAL